MAGMFLGGRLLNGVAVAGEECCSSQKAVWQCAALPESLYAVVAM